MTEQRLKVESGPPEHVVSDARDRAEVPPHEEQSAAADAKDKVQEAAAGAKEKAQEVAAPAKQKARDIAGQAKGHAQAAAEQAKGKAAAQVDERSTQVGQQIGSQAQSLDGVADELRRQGKDGPAKLAEQAGERVKSVGSYLEQTDGDSLVQAVADAARENPAAAAAAGAAAGFAAGRLLKASRAGDDSPEEDEAAHPDGAGGPS
jgi:alanyl-tRNA synthetase